MIRDFVDGTAYVDDGSRAVPDNSTGTAGNVVVSVNGTVVDWGSADSLCVKCHAGWLNAYSWH